MGIKGSKHTEEAKRKIKEHHAKYWLGKHHSEGHNEIIRLSMLGKNKSSKSTQTKKKISDTLKRKFESGELAKPTGLLEYRKENNVWNLGKKGLQIAWNKGLSKETDERVKRISDKRKGYIPSKEQIEKYKIWRRTEILPKKDTTIEVKLQNYLKDLGIDFLTHQYIKDIEHGYQCDILIPSMNLVIECDGDYWHNYPIGRDIDHIRTSELLEKGFKVLRLWETEIRKMDLYAFKYKLINNGT